MANQLTASLFIMKSYWDHRRKIIKQKEVQTGEVSNHLNMMYLNARYIKCWQMLISFNPTDYHYFPRPEGLVIVYCILLSSKLLLNILRLSLLFKVILRYTYPKQKSRFSVYFDNNITLARDPSSDTSICNTDSSSQGDRLSCSQARCLQASIISSSGRKVGQEGIFTWTCWAFNLEINHLHVDMCDLAPESVSRCEAIFG